jgi:membrane-bound serine protease (ClpP class)
VWLGLGLLAAGTLLALPPAAQAQAGPEVLVVHIEGVVTQGTAIHVQDAIDAATARGGMVLLRLETPGGLVDATLDIHKSIERAQVPVLAWVGPAGAEAASAGTLILLMGTPAGMAPDTQIGSAQPISVNPDGSTSDAGDKIQNFLVERMRIIADRAGRDADLAARFITENLNMDEDDALASGLIDAIAPNERAFLDAVHGHDAVVGVGVQTLDTANARIVVFDRSVMSRVVDILSNPQIAFILVLAGTYALIFGLANPGTYAPETIGALLLIVGFIGLGLFSTNTAGILLLGMALVFFVIEVFTPTNGILTGVGVAALILAAVFLLDEPLLGPGFLKTFYFAGVALAVVSGGAVFGAVTIAVRTRDKPVADRFRDATGTAIEPVGPEGGRVTVHGEVWMATSQVAIAAETPIRVLSRTGLVLHVEPTTTPTTPRTTPPTTPATTPSGATSTQPQDAAAGQGKA